VAEKGGRTRTPSVGVGRSGQNPRSYVMSEYEDKKKSGRSQNFARRAFSVYRSNIFYSTAAAFRLLRFQYKYPGTPTSTIAVPQKASLGRVMIVFSVHAAPTST
jgi:hypothetical protein